MAHDLSLCIINRGQTRADHDGTAKVDGECRAVLTQIVAQLEQS